MISDVHHIILTMHDIILHISVMISYTILVHGEGCATSAVMICTRASSTRPQVTWIQLRHSFFRQTPASETNVNHVKRTVFCVTDGAPILAEDHNLYCHGQNHERSALYVKFHSDNVPLTPTACSRLDSCSFRRTEPSLGGP